MDRVTLTLAVPKPKGALEEKYYVVGDICELGSWQEKKLMKRIPRRAGASKKENLGHASGQSSEEDSFTYSFYTYRNKELFYYYYIKKGSTIQSERKPGRVFYFQNQKRAHPYRRKVTHSRGDINVVD
jgi:hypothetical protein